MFSFRVGSLLARRSRLVKQGVAWLLFLLLTLFWCGGAHAQGDTTPPAISFHNAEGTPSFTSLPTPLSGTVFDAGGMGGLTARLMRAPNGTLEFWNGSAWTTNDKYWLIQVTPSGAAGNYNWSVSISWPTGANLPPDRYVVHVSGSDSAGNSAASERDMIVAPPDTTRPAIALNAADGTTTFTSLPSPLSGTVFDAGGMGGMLSARLMRAPSGTLEFWNGSAWTTQDKYWMAQVAPAGAPGEYNWSVSATWPTGADLPPGRYVIHVSALDNAGNSAAIERDMMVGPADTTPPGVVIGTPAEGELFDNESKRLTAISGTVNDGDGSGLGYVEVYLSHKWSQQFRMWNGQTWVSYAKLATVLGAPDADGNQTWSVPASALPPAEQLATGQYYLDVLPYDRAGNRGFARHVFNVAPFDGTPPTAEVTFPVEGQQLTRLPAIRGTSHDVGSGVSQVDVYLVNRTWRADGSENWLFWNGSGWQSAGIALPNSRETGWTRDQSLPSGADLPAGDYVVMLQVQDNYNNVSDYYRVFSIVPVPPLSIDAHIRADASAAWLGEGFSNADASGQTLSGTIASNETQSRAVRLVRSGGDASKTVRVTIPDWAAFAAAGWTASFTNPGNGIDITAEITSAQGWQTVMNDGDAQQFNVEVTAPANASAGQTSALTFRVEADPTSETNALDVVKATWRVVAPTPDLAIRAEGGAWQGETVMNADGAGQTIERVSKPGATVRGQIKLSVAEAQNGQSVRWSVPDWDAFRADGWTAKFYDAPDGGNEITDQITGEGWTTRHTEGFEPIIGWEMTAPEGASDVTRVLGVRAQVGGGAVDVVKAIVRVLPNVQPDVSISRLNKNGGIENWVGKSEFSPKQQQVKAVVTAGEVRSFAMQIKNTSAQTTQFLLKLPSLPSGWSLKVYDAIEDGQLLDANDENTILTPEIKAGDSIDWKVEVTTGVSDEAETLPFNVSAGSLADEVEIEITEKAVRPPHLCVGI